MGSPVRKAWGPRGSCTNSLSAKHRQLETEQLPQKDAKHLLRHPVGLFPADAILLQPFRWPQVNNEKMLRVAVFSVGPCARCGGTSCPREPPLLYPEDM